MSDKKAFPLFDLLVDRGKNVLTVSVPEHEIKVLRHVHGAFPPNQARIEVVGKNEDSVELNASADAEFARLQATYYRVNTEDLVIKAYPGGAEDLVKFGFELGRGPVEAAPASMVKKHKATAKAAAK